MVSGSRCAVNGACLCVHIPACQQTLLLRRSPGQGVTPCPYLGHLHTCCQTVKARAQRCDARTQRCECQGTRRLLCAHKRKRWLWVRKGGLHGGALTRMEAAVEFLERVCVPKPCWTCVLTPWELCSQVQRCVISTTRQEVSWATMQQHSLLPVV